MNRYEGYFDVVFMEGGILHYFHNIDDFMNNMYSLLRPGGKMICSDFHPFQKIADILNLEQPVIASYQCVMDVYCHAQMHIFSSLLMNFSRNTPVGHSLTPIKVNSPGNLSFVHAGCSSNLFRLIPQFITALIISLTVYFR